MGKFMEAFPFKEVRPIQEDILNALERVYRDSDRFRYVLIEAGTGVGKSAIAKAIAAVEGDAYVLTATKQLQDQYVRDFAPEAATVKGKFNYKCSKDEEYSCAHGKCMAKGNAGLQRECEGKGECPYANALKAAQGAELFVTSYAYFLSHSRLAKTVAPKSNPISRRKAVIIDECHLLEDQLCSSAAITLSQRRLNNDYGLMALIADDPAKLIGFNQELTEDGYEANADWLGLVHSLLQLLRANLSAELEALSSLDRGRLTVDQLAKASPKEVKRLAFKLRSVNDLINRLDGFLALDDKSNWLVTAKDGELTIQPIRVGTLFKDLVDEFAEQRVVMMSATILDKRQYVKDLGLDPEHVAVITRESTFPAWRSPIVSAPVGSMSYANLPDTMPRIVEKVKEILAAHPNEKGIIHTSTYNVAKYITSSLKSSRLLYLSNPADTNEFLLTEHARSRRPTVLVSPSMMAGVDLAGELARFQVVVKLPFASMADPRVKRCMAEDRGWYAVKTMRNLAQACGRATRSEDDWAVTYVLDSYFDSFLRQHARHFGQHFCSRVVPESQFNLVDFRRAVLE